MQFFLETLVAIFYYPISRIWFFLPTVIALYFLLHLGLELFYFRKRDKKKDLPYNALKGLVVGNLNQEEREYFAKHLDKEAKDFYFNQKPLSSRSRLNFWVPERLFTKNANLKKVIIQFCLLVFAAAAFLPFIQYGLAPLNSLLVNALGEQTRVEQIEKGIKSGIVSYQKLYCYTLNYSTQEGSSYEVERCDPLYFPSKAISYLKHYPTVIAAASE
ncbi:hypothetical protein OURE66S_03946 [Oligella ureolytica]